MSEMLRAEGLQKRYGQRLAVADVSFTLAAGEILGLLGPNGAGKSTTVGMLTGLLAPDAGRVTVGGLALDQHTDACKRRIGLVPQELALFDELPARANVMLFGALYGLPKARQAERAAAVLAQVGLSERAKDKPATFSGGMKRRLNIACALVHDPDVLLFDEPTAGVDPQSRLAIFDTLRALRAAGKALVYTTHYMEEAERLADRIVIVDHGRVVAAGSLAELLQQRPAAQTLRLQLDGAPDLDALRQLPGITQVTMQPGELTVSLGDLARDAPALLQAIAAAGLRVHKLDSGRAGLEEVFLALTGHALRD